MQLSDLFVSHKQVDPVTFDREEPTLPQPIYLNLDRAKKVTTDDTADATSTEEDMSTWSVDPDYDGITFRSKWQDYRENTFKDDDQYRVSTSAQINIPKLKDRKRKICVKAVDVFGFESVVVKEI